MTFSGMLPDFVIDTPPCSWKKRSPILRLGGKESRKCRSEITSEPGTLRILPCGGANGSSQKPLPGRGFRASCPILGMAFGHLLLLVIGILSKVLSC